MTLTQISELSQAIAAVAVLVSLIYLASQTRLSAQSQQAMMHGNRADWVSTVLERIADPEFAEVWRAGATASPDMSVLDAHRFAYFTMGHLIGFQNNFLDWRAGLIDDNRWGQSHRALRGYLNYPGYRATYLLQRESYHPDFRTLVDGHLAEAKAEAGRDTAKAWLAMAAQERVAIGAGATQIA